MANSTLQAEHGEVRLQRTQTEEKPSDSVGIKDGDKPLPSHNLLLSDLEHLAIVKNYRLAIKLMGVALAGCLAFIAYLLL